MFHSETGIFKTSYAADMALYPLPVARWAVAGLAVLFVFVVPWVASPYLMTLLNLVLIAIVGAVGLDILVGFTGLISIGEGGFMSVGAYTAANLIVRLGLPFWLAIPAGGLMAALVGIIVGIPSLRIKGLYLAIATLAAQFIIEWLINHVTWISGGIEASIQVPPPELFGWKLVGSRQLYYFLLFFAVLAIVATLNLMRSRIGRAFIAIRDRDIANYEQFGIDVSIDYLAMIIIGGLGSVLGSIFGAIFITLLPEATRLFLTDFGSIVFSADTIRRLVPNLTLILFGGLIIFFLIVEPEGLNRLWRNVRNYFRVWPFSY